MAAADRLDSMTLDERCINTIRFLAVDAVQKADSGHPGMPMGTAPLAYVLWDRHLRHHPQHPDWPNRDRFVLSAGHGSMLLYALLHLTGYDLPMEELKNFRQWKSKTPGHPENFITKGVETTTGPLGQGVANGVGLAIAERFMAARFNRDGFPIVDHHTYGIVSDGDLMEGISHEAASLAGHLGLGKLIYFYDDNEISIDGSTDLAFTEDVDARFEAYGWHVVRVEDGNDLEAIEAALEAAKAETGKPSLIVTRTVIGYGSPNRAGTAKAHGEPLGEEERELTKENLGWPEETFLVPDSVADHMGQAVARGEKLEAEWNERFARYADAHPDLADEYKAWQNGDLPADWDADLPTFDTGSKLATRAASGKVLDALGPKLPNLIGGSADLTPSNKTDIDGRDDHQADNPSGAYFRFGVREHGMASICNGISLHNSGLRPYCATFLIFSDYLRPAMRLSALMGEPVIYVYTHDSIGLGEDGPTHQPVEHYMALRAIPNLTLIRPADARETVEAWKAALQNTDGPTALSLTRQGLPTLMQTEDGGALGLHQGAYVLEDPGEGDPDLILIASGSEVQLALAAANTLRKSGTSVRVVSMPSWELFAAQPQAYQEKVLPPAVTKRVAIEAGVTMGWERYVGLQGRIIGLDRFGASAPGEVLFEQFGFTAERVVEEARAVLDG